MFHFKSNSCFQSSNFQSDILYRFEVPKVYYGCISVQCISLFADEDPDRVALAKLRGKMHGCHPIPVHSVNLQPDYSGARFPSGPPSEN